MKISKITDYAALNAKKSSKYVHSEEKVCLLKNLQLVGRQNRIGFNNSILGNAFRV